MTIKYLKKVQKLYERRGMKAFKPSLPKYMPEDIVMNGHELFPEFNITFFSGYEFYFNRYYIYDDITDRLLFVKMDSMEFCMKDLYMKLVDELDYKIHMIDIHDYDLFVGLTAEERKYYKTTYRKYLLRARRILLFGRNGRDKDTMVSKQMEKERRGDF